MPPASSPIVINDDVSSAVTKLIREANERLILVSPYNSFWDHLRNEIHLAITKRGVQVTVVYREGEKENDDIIWLRKEGATVHVVDRLHAKLYLNESSVLLTSMNLLQSSREKSKEVGIYVNDADAQRELRNYVDDLIHLGKKVSPAPASAQTRTAAELTVQTRSAGAAGGLPDAGRSSARTAHARQHGANAEEGHASQGRHYRTLHSLRERHPSQCGEALVPYGLQAVGKVRET